MEVSETMKRGIAKRAAQFDLDLSDLEIEAIATWGLEVLSGTNDASAAMACIDYEILERAGQIPLIDESKWRAKQEARKGNG